MEPLGEDGAFFYCIISFFSSAFIVTCRPINPPPLSLLCITIIPLDYVHGTTLDMLTFRLYDVCVVYIPN